MAMTSSRIDRIAYGAACYIGKYRKNPHLFARDYLHLRLKIFQKILLIMMNWSTCCVFIGSRGIGKTFLSAVYCVTRCVLYPGSKIVIASGTRGQAANVLEKIMLELVPNSRELAAEIDMRQTRLNGAYPQVVFKNGSFIKVVSASDSSRGSRANALLLDEFRLISKDVIDTVLKKFLTQRRMPMYSELTNEERMKEYAKEKNITMYLSSAYTTDHWSYTKCIDTFKAMMDSNRRDFVCGLPYELSISEGLLDPDTVESEMLESDFSEVKHMMEYEAIWYGSAEGAFFDFNTVARNRRIRYPMLPYEFSSKLRNDKMVSIPPKQNGEKRILSADIALMASKKHQNDATAIHITQLSPTKAGRYTVNLVYSEANEGLQTEAQALVIRRLYEEYDCDYIVLDTRSIGLSIFDCLANDMSDVERGEIYPALSCCNNDAIADRCTVRGAPKVIWAIMGSSKFNSDCALMLREGFRSGRIRLLVNEYDAEVALNELKGYGALDANDKTKIMLPYIHTTLLINELINLQYEESGGLVKVYEKSGMRKDRYSSLSYNYWVALQLENKMRKNAAVQESYNSEQFMYRAPKVR